jgi:hypothetical protein
MASIINLNQNGGAQRTSRAFTQKLKHKKSNSDLFKIK